MSIDIDVLTRLFSFTTPRGWVLIVLTAIGGYLVLGTLGAFAFTLGAAAGLSASEWEEEVDDADRGTPLRRDHASDSPEEGWLSWRRRSDGPLRFASLNHPMPTLRALA